MKPYPLQISRRGAPYINDFWVSNRDKSRISVGVIFIQSSHKTPSELFFKDAVLVL